MQSTRSSGTISSSASQGSSSREAGPQPVPHALGKEPADTGDQPDRHRACRATAAAAREPLTARNSVGTDRRGFEEHQVGLGHGGTQSSLRDVERPRSPAAAASARDRSPRRGRRPLAGRDRPGAAARRRSCRASRAPRRLRLAGSAWASTWAVVSAAMSPAASHISLRGSPAVSTRAANHTSAPGGGLARNDAAARGDETLWIVLEGQQGPRRLLHQDVLGSAGRACHVSQPLDGMHRARPYRASITKRDGLRGNRVSRSCRSPTARTRGATIRRTYLPACLAPGARRPGAADPRPAVGRPWRAVPLAVRPSS